MFERQTYLMVSWDKFFLYFLLNVERDLNLLYHSNYFLPRTIIGRNEIYLLKVDSFERKFQVCCNNLVHKLLNVEELFQM